VDLTRRQLLAAITGVVAGAATSASPAHAIDAPPILPSTRPWRALPGEVEPDVKRRATRLLETVGAWTDGAGGGTAARRRAEAAGFDPQLVEALTPLLGSQASAVLQVRDAQYGGIQSSSASVLVLVDQWRAGAGGSVDAGGTTIDVRLVRASPHWRVVDAFPARQAPAAAHLSVAARRVLSDARIRLPHAAESDVRSGAIHDSVLRMLSALSGEHVVDVSILRSGHPLLVFGTSRRSDHPRGRAVDIWALDSHPLVVPANHPLAIRAMRLAVDHGAYNVGGPVQLDGPQFFSDRTHQDHVHLGFDH
jgi:hypothetical protein